MQLISKLRQIEINNITYLAIVIKFSDVIDNEIFSLD